MINIYEKNETTFTNNGIATLEPMTCDLTMTINGAWVLSIEHPYDQEGKWKELQKGRIIQVTDINILRNCSTSQRYRIYDTTETLTSIKAIAFPVGMEATYDAIIEEIRLKGKTGNQAVSALSTYLTDSGVTKYTLTVSGLSAKARTVEYKDTNLIAALCGQDDDSIVNKYNAEVAYNNYQIFIKDSIGSATNYDVRLGKNLTGLSYEIDDSDVVTRIYPLASDGVRLNEFNTGMSGENHYIDSLDIELFPYNRAAFVTVPYNLIDTDVDALVKTDTIIATKSAYDNIYDYVSESMERVWGLICAYNQFTYTHEQIEETILMVPELLQSLITNVSQTIAENVLTTKGVNHPGLRSWLTNAIKAGLDWIKEEDLPDKNWIQNQDNSYSYGNSLRKLTNEWANIDGKMSYFDANSKWVPEKDDPIAWDWVQKKGHNKKYGNNKRYCARDTYVYTMSTGGVFSQYWFDADGWWDEEGEESDWNWYQSGDKWWFGASDAGDNPSKYAHDTWLFIKSSNDASTSGGKPTLYYFGSDGFMVPSLSVVNIDWDWHQTKNKWYFGNTNTEYRAEYATEQWLYIDGDWYYFDENGYSIDIKIFPRAVIDILTDYLQYELVGDEIVSQQNNLYNLLYQLMEAYCNDLYADGLDKPLINVAIDFVDLSKTQEYASYSALETICLGDSVKVTYDTYGSYVEEEVVGLTYDCLKGCNTQITVGRASKTVSQMFDTSVKGADNGQRLVAGENVTITGNAINVSSQVGDVYAGDTVSVQQIQSTGTPIARISVNGVPTTIYAVGTDVEVEPIKTEGDKIATITVGGVDYDIYADTGLKYWVETQTDIYREGSHTETTYNNSYYFDEIVYWQTRSGHSYHGHWDFKKANDIPAYIGKVATGEEKYFILVSEDEDGVDWLVNDVSYEPTGYGEPPIGEYPLEYKHTGNITYKGKTYYYSVGRYYYDTPHTETDSFSYVPNVDTSSPYSDMAKAIIDATEITTTLPDIFGVSNNPNDDKILWYSSNGTHTSHTDDVYITKDGVFNGTEFRINGQTLGGFYKTTLYQGNTYSASVSLSDSYRDYDLLMIETYNQDDKNNYASMVSVADLSTGSYIGVSGYLMYTIANARSLTFHEAPNDSNHSRYIKAVYGFRTTHDSGTVPPLEDVTVDGVSVVSGGVASISLSEKQDVLTAGDNIQIGADGKTISATDTTYSDFSGGAHGLVPPVQTQSGKFLKDDGTWASGAGGASNLVDLGDVNISSPSDSQVLQYDATSQKWINASGGGTTVIANPSGTATDTLTKIQVDNTIYGIQGGGGGGSVIDVYENGVSCLDSNHIAQVKTHKEVTASEYAALTTAEKNNGTLYLSNGTTGITTPIENISIGKYIENASCCQDEVSSNGKGVISYYYSGSMIGNDFWLLEKIDVTNYAYLKYNLSLGSCYGTSSANWYYTVGLMDSIPSNWYYAGDSRYVVKKSYTNQGVSYTDETLDVSNLTGEYYIVVVAHGWNANLNNIRLVSVNTQPNRIYFMSTEFANNGGGTSNQITYGTTTPTSSGNDGDLYILLDGNNSKQSEYLYMNGSWVQIE